MKARKLKLPEQKRRHRIALAPLADAMFQLLIFFMLTTSLTPYSLLTLTTAETGQAPQTESNSTSSASQSGEQVSQPSSNLNVLIWTLSNNSISFDRQSYDLEQVIELAGAISEQEVDANLILVIKPDARIQDVSTVLEALNNANLSEIQITIDEE